VLPVFNLGDFESEPSETLNFDSVSLISWLKFGIWTVILFSSSWTGSEPWTSFPLLLKLSLCDRAWACCLLVTSSRLNCRENRFNDEDSIRNLWESMQTPLNLLNFGSGKRLGFVSVLELSEFFLDFDSNWHERETEFCLWVGTDEWICVASEQWPAFYRLTHVHMSL